MKLEENALIGLRILQFILLKNLINRNFHGVKTERKWFTDVSYLFYGNHEKAYLSAIIDTYDMSVVSYVISKRNDNELVMSTLKQGLKGNSNNQLTIHTDRGYQYTSREYSNMKDRYGFQTSMSRPGKCLDNQPIESFWEL
ncbi:DDE-type integrase/transposase/recombinase [Enterococcus wangshanyuanii]|uniref:DDE-type integrase/transposase/recombinase n=1 Tax=Enterococcus wangshanyuanii TaxID=2005703 RepID=UPI000B4B1ED2